MKILRIEHIETNDGMWYNKSGDYTPVILELTDAKAKMLPMDIDIEKYHANGKVWLSGCSDQDKLDYWFTPEDRAELYDRGYALFSLDVDDFIIEEHQVLFTRESIKSVQKLEGKEPKMSLVSDFYDKINKAHEAMENSDYFDLHSDNNDSVQKWNEMNAAEMKIYEDFINFMNNYGARVSEEMKEHLKPLNVDK